MNRLVFAQLFWLIVWPGPRLALGHEQSPPPTAHSIIVGDARLYYEVYGGGPAVVLLHGGLFGSIAEFSALIPQLSRGHRVIAIEARGHGRSELGSARLSYELFAADVAAIIRARGVQRADIVGFSDGAITAYHVAASYPSLVRRVVAIGGPLGIHGYSAAGAAELDAYDTPGDLERFAPAFVRARKKVMPDQAMWSRFITELAAMWKARQYISAEKVQSITSPVLLIAGDRDQYARAEHLVEIYRLLPRGKLALLPGTDHMVLKSNPAIAHALILSFLDAP